MNAAGNVDATPEWWVATRPIRRHAITALSITSVEPEGEVLVAAAEFGHEDLRRLFQSRGAQRALGLLEARVRLAR